MNILLLGSGGREHAFAYKLSQSPLLSNLYIAPGNAGTSQCGTNLNFKVDDFLAIKSAVLEYNISLVVVGPEDPLVKGIHDFFLADDALRTIALIGPKKDGARLEGSKDFSKSFMERNKIPAGKSKTFTAEEINDGLDFLKTMQSPYVLKADGLAAGKGVVIHENLTDAEVELKAMLLDKKFGQASTKVLIEEFLRGIELSVFVLTDGESYKLLPSAKDYKRIGEGDTGLNTGGMGAVSPVPFADSDFLKKVEDRIVIPTIYGLKNEGIDYRGFIFIGLMNVNGNPMVIEYNCRMGDPETEVVIPLLDTDLVELFLAISKQELEKVEIKIKSQTSVTVMCVAGGYPSEYKKGKTIMGIENVNDTIAFHAGTAFAPNGEIVTNGGRVIALTSFGKDIAEATAKCMKAADAIQYEGKYFRRDIGKDLL